MNKEVVFHEDDYCQIELIPRENFLLTNQEVGTIVDSVLHKTGENGFIEIHSRNQIKIPLQSLNISLNELTEILKTNSLTMFDSVFKSNGQYKELMKDTIAYVFENYAVFVTRDNDVVRKIWIIYKKISDTLNVKPIKLAKALNQIGIVWRILLVDWNELITVNLGDDKQLDTYISNVL